MIKRIDYDAYGNILVDSNPTYTLPIGFAGGLRDAHTGLLRFGYRDYDPEVGRWTAKDPLGLLGGDTNLYGYALCDPVKLVDPDGQAIPALILLGYAAVEVAMTAYDIYDTLTTVADPCASTIDKGVSIGGLALGGLLPGAGYDPAMKYTAKLGSPLKKPGAPGGGGGSGGGGSGGGAAGGGGGGGAKKHSPNPDGKKGSPAHQSAVDQVAQDIENRGLEPLKEFYIRTPNGQKNGRFADVVL